MKSQLDTKTLGANIVQVHYVRPLFHDMQHVHSSETATAILREVADPCRIDLKEFFWVMLLTNTNRLLGISELSIGCTNGVTVNCKEIFQLGLLTNASAIIVAHNHPSGQLQPSAADVMLSKKLSKFGRLVQITLLDHIILTQEGCTSMADRQML